MKFMSFSPSYNLTTQKIKTVQSIKYRSFSNITLKVPNRFILIK